MNKPAGRGPPTFGTTHISYVRPAASAGHTLVTGADLARMSGFRAVVLGGRTTSTLHVGALTVASAAAGTLVLAAGRTVGGADPSVQWAFPADAASSIGPDVLALAGAFSVAGTVAYGRTVRFLAMCESAAANTLAIPAARIVAVPMVIKMF